MTSRKKVVLIGWDAADWKVINPLMDRGLMPNLRRLVEGGSMAHITTLYPPLSPMLWTSIATGKRPFKHGIHGFSEPTEDGLSIRPVTNLSRTCKAVWNILLQNGLKSIVIGWWPSHPAEPIDGVMVSDQYHKVRKGPNGDWPLLPGTIHPPELNETLAELRLHWNEVAGEMVDPFVPLAREVDQKKDRRLAALVSTLAECISTHSAAAWLIENQPWDLFAVYYDAIDHFSHGFMKYHPPKQNFIKQKDFDLYSNVVSSAYVLHDQMLGGLLRKLNDDVTVMLVSDHGFHPDHLRPNQIPSIPAGPAIEHRDFGIFALKGPGIKHDELLHGVSVLDIAPTLLRLFDLPVGEDMDGKVLVKAFEASVTPATIPSWEEIPGYDGRHPPDTRIDPVAASEALAQLVALGYIAKPNENIEKAIEETVSELRYNLGQSYQDADRHAEALEIFRELNRLDPNEQRYAVHRFVSCQALGLVGEMRSIVEDLDGRRRQVFTEGRAGLNEFVGLFKLRLAERNARNEAAGQQNGAEVPDPPEAPDQEVAKPELLFTEEERREIARLQNLARFEPPVVDYLMARVLGMEGNHAQALETLGRVQQANRARPGLFLQTAELYMKLGRWEEAEAVFSKALEIDPDNAHAHLGMCRMHLRRRDHPAAAQSALESLERLYHHPFAHFLLSVALRGMKDYRRAVAALRTAVSLNPNFAQAHRLLASILGRRLNDPVGSAEHMRMYRSLRSAARRPAKTSIASKPAPIGEPAVSALPDVDAVDMAEGDKGVVIVSGLPRSGTSMIMQMLAAGGQTVLVDGLREADISNPRGYFAFEPVKQLRKDAQWLSESEGKAVKIVAPLLPYLPRGVACHVIFIERELDEVLSSQSLMLAKRGEPVSGSRGRDDRLKAEYTRTVRKIKQFLRDRPNTRMLPLNHSTVVRDPESVAASINRFLGGRLNVEAMAAEVNPSLHRNRSGSGVPVAVSR